MKAFRLLLQTMLTLLCAHSGAQGQEWALPRVSVACVREEPGHASELGTQVVTGTPLRVLQREGEWVHVGTPDGYRGWIIKNSLTLLSETQYQEWLTSDRVIVTSAETQWLTEAGDSLTRVADLVEGCVLGVVKRFEGDSLLLKLPDGRKGILRGRKWSPLQEWATQKVSAEAAADYALKMMGMPYLWGGTSPRGFDCSGMTKLAWGSQGVILPRNASQQARLGLDVTPQKGDFTGLKKGDLLFFGNGATGRVNHVGIYLGYYRGGTERFVHCSGRVKVNSLAKMDSLYAPLTLLGARRLMPADIEALRVPTLKWVRPRAK